MHIVFAKYQQPPILQLLQAFGGDAVQGNRIQVEKCLADLKLVIHKDVKTCTVKGALSFDFQLFFQLFIFWMLKQTDQMDIACLLRWTRFTQGREGREIWGVGQEEVIFGPLTVREVMEVVNLGTSLLITNQKAVFNNNG